MTALEVRSSTKTKQTTPATGQDGKSKPNSKLPKSSPAPAGQPETTAPKTKQDLILSLLSQRNGATIAEMMQATGWQQHSVRGFLAGTVKKKLGLALISSKSDGALRRYRIAPRRGR
jgi:hypothetical protein